MKKHTNLTNIIRRTTREISKIRFSYLSQRNDAEIIEYQQMNETTDRSVRSARRDLIYSAEIEINMSDLRIEFRCFYSSDTEKKIIQAQYGDIPLAENEVPTFLGEFCNLVGGSLKNILQDSFEGLRSDKNYLSIPKIISNINPDDFIASKTRNDSWFLKCEKYFILCQIVIQFKKDKNISIIDRKIKNKEAEIVFSDNGGEIIYSFESLNNKTNKT
ncbi:MAG: hypothetical protein HQK49_21170 [Oligoflexia bacterium]|nr:hypothetical protein [Oligoflexia bacterium]